VVRARVLADAGASKSTGNNRHKSPTPNTSSGRTHPPASLSAVGLVSHQTHSEALPSRLWRLSDKPGDLTSLAAPSLLASCQ
jgi:hypothetical protein